jgi:hypothetical protein
MNFYIRWLHKLESRFLGSRRLGSSALVSSSTPFSPQARQYHMELLLYPESGQPSLVSAPPFDPAVSYAFVCATFESAISEIAAEFDQACREREFLIKQSTEWQKLTGKMLAYARATALLENMKGTVSPVLHSTK